MSSKHTVSKRYLSDLKYGAEKEQIAEKYLKKIYKDLQHTSNKYARYDFYSIKHKKIIEIKGKKCKWNERDYFMLQKDKVDYYEEHKFDYEVYYVFNDNSIYKLIDPTPHHTKLYRRNRIGKLDKKKLFHYYKRNQLKLVKDPELKKWKTYCHLDYHPIVTDLELSEMKAMMI